MQDARAVIFQGPNVRNFQTDNTVIHTELALDKVKEQVKERNVSQNNLVIINTHGSIAHFKPHSVQTHTLEFESTIDIFEELGKAGNKLNILLYACYAGAACTTQIMSKLPKGSFAGFYAP